MILYTIMPQELIYPASPESFTTQKLVTINSVPILVEQSSSHEYRIVRVLSTDPNVFLNELYSPGSIISSSPESYMPPAN